MRNIYVNLNLEQLFRRCHLKHFLSKALAALIFGGNIYVKLF